MNKLNEQIEYLTSNVLHKSKQFDYCGVIGDFALVAFSTTNLESINYGTDKEINIPRSGQKFDT